MIKSTSRSYVILVKGGKFLLIQNWLGRQHWQLPGGGVRWNEPPRQAAIRELKEELGLRLSPQALMKVTEGHWLEDGLGFHYFIFKSTYPSGTGISKKTAEIIRADWLTFTELERAKVPDQVLNAIKLSLK